MTMSQKCSEDDNEAEEIRKLVRETAELAGRFDLSEHIWLCKNFDLQGLGKRCKEVPNRFDAMTEKIIKAHEEARKEDKGTSEKVPSPSIQMPSKEIVVFDPILEKTQLKGSFFQPVSPSFSPDEVSIKAFASSRSSVDRRWLTIGPLGISVPRPKNPQKLKYSKKHSTQVLLFFKEQQSADCSKTGLQFRRSYRYPLVSNVQKHLFLRMSRMKRLFL